MARSLPPIVWDILQALLDQAEQPGRSPVARVRLNEQRYPAYYAEHNAAPRRETNAALQELASQEVVRLGWRRWEEGNWLETVDLIPAHTETVYTLLERTPRDAREDTLRVLLARQPRLAGWHADFVSWAEARLTAHRTVAPLDLEQPSWNDDVLRLLAAVATLQSPTLERTLSVRLFGDSKRAETLRRALLTVLRRHAPEAAAYADDDWALLRAHQLDRVPEYIPIAGPLVLQLHDRRLDTTPFVPSIALSAATIDQLTAASCSARALVPIENATSFSEFTVARASDIAVLYTGGFASPSVARNGQGDINALREGFAGGMGRRWAIKRYQDVISSPARVTRRAAYCSLGWRAPPRRRRWGRGATRHRGRPAPGSPRHIQPTEDCAPHPLPRRARRATQHCRG